MVRKTSFRTITIGVEAAPHRREIRLSLEEHESNWGLFEPRAGVGAGG